MSEAALGQAADPRALVGGDPAALAERSATLRRFAEHLGASADGLERIDLRRWTGAAAERFRERFGENPQRWRDAATAFDRASRALGEFSGAVTTAQDRAREAIDLHVRAVAASQAARDDYNRRVETHNATLAAGGTPTPMEPFVDPTTGDLARAEQVLADARRARDEAAARVAGEVRGAAELTAPPPSTVTQIANDVADGARVVGTVRDHLVTGAQHGVEGLGQVVRTINPLDPYNLTHPAQAGSNASDLGAGVVRSVAHPTELVKGVVGTGWGSDPAGAVGELLPNLVGGGAGATGRLARAATRTENRTLERLVTRGDPVDVVSGAQILRHVDVALDAPLPLVLSRVHVSSYELGRLFGRRWASTLDQRLEFVAGAIWFVREDAVVVAYPAPEGTEPVRPAAPDHAPRWPLRRDGEGWALTDPATGFTRTFLASGALAGWSVPGGDHVVVERDDAGLPVAVRHSGGHVVDVRTADGMVTGYALRGAGPVVAFTPTDGQLGAVVDPAGRALRFTYDAAGRMASWTDRNDVTYRSAYDARGRCVRGTAGGGEMAWSFRYAPGVTESTDALGHSERWEHDRRGRVVRHVDALGAETRSVWADGDRLLARTDAVGGVTRWSYDEAGAPSRVARPDGSVLAVGRDGAGRIVRAEEGGRVWSWTLDADGRVVAARDPAGAVSRCERDGAGHVVASIDPLGARTGFENDAAGRPLVVTDARGGVTRLERDAAGRVHTSRDPLGASWQLTWTVDGRLASRTAPDGARWSWEYDGEGNEVLARDPLGAVTRREYGPFDVGTAVVDSAGARTEIEHDALRQVVAVRSAVGQVWRSTLDAAGRPVAETDFDGRTVTLERDALGRVVHRRNASGQEVRWEYGAGGAVVRRWIDGAEERFDHDDAGLLVGARSAAGAFALERDAAGRVVAETVDGRTVRTARDATGRVVARSTPSGTGSVWRYDDGGAPRALELGGRSTDVTVDAAGRTTSFGPLEQDWDAAGRLVGQRVAGPSGLARTYTYRPDDHLVRVEDVLAGARTFDMDPAGRVVRVRGEGWSESYGYDPAGTLAASGVGEPHVLDGTRVRRAGSLVVRHDADGRIVLRQRRRLGARPSTWHFRWDALDRLVGVTTPSGERWRYRYDVFDRRVAKERLGPDGEVVEDVLLAWDGTLLAEETHRRGDDVETTTWEWEPGTHRPVAQLTQSAVDERFRAIVTDLVGTPTELLDPDGTVVGASRATLWGRTTWTGEATPLRFPGQYHDAETGLAYNLHRYYDPDTAQYASPDPLGLAPSPHPHAYVPNPTSEIDPLGLQACEPGPPFDIIERVERLGPDIPNGPIPKVFNFEVNGRMIHVHPNAMKHINERLGSELSWTSRIPDAANLSARLHLESLWSALRQFTADGIQPGHFDVANGWELMLSQRPGDLFPVLKHARKLY